jgi:hypothetical protein
MDELIELTLMTNLGRVPATPFWRGDFSLRILFWGRVLASIFKRPGSGNQAGFLPAARRGSGWHHSRDKKYVADRSGDAARSNQRDPRKNSGAAICLSHAIVCFNGSRDRLTDDWLGGDWLVGDRLVDERLTGERLIGEQPLGNRPCTQGLSHDSICQSGRRPERRTRRHRPAESLRLLHDLTRLGGISQQFDSGFPGRRRPDHEVFSEAVEVILEFFEFHRCRVPSIGATPIPTEATPKSTHKNRYLQNINRRICDFSPNGNR